MVRDHREHPLHVGQEAEVEHLIGLVQHQHLDPAEHQVAAVGQVEQPARGADDQVDTGVQGGDLRLVGAAAVDRGDRQAEELADLVQVAGDLHAEFAGRHHHQGPGGPAGGQLAIGVGDDGRVHRQALQQRHAETEGLAHTGAGLADEVMAAQRDRQRQGLDGEGAFDADGAEGGDDPRVRAELGESRCLRLDGGVGGQRVGDRCVLRVDGRVGHDAIGIGVGGCGIADQGVENLRVLRDVGGGSIDG